MTKFYLLFLTLFMQTNAPLYQFEEGTGLVFKYMIEDLKGTSAFSIARKCSIENKQYVHTVELNFDKLKLDVVNTTPDSDDYKNCEGVEIESIALTKDKALCYNKEEQSVINIGFIAFMDKSCQNDMLKYFKGFMGKPEKNIPFDAKIIENRCSRMLVKMKSSNPNYYNMAVVCDDKVGVVFISKEMLSSFESTRRLIEEKVEDVENRPKAKDDF
ncbi:MAG: hypothetical protein N3B13_05220 [Deltaproteobacteria bacterium]|nr:hypothetical protein [Deltaproteobacteria bacterium]